MRSALFLALLLVAVAVRGDGDAVEVRFGLQCVLGASRGLAALPCPNTTKGLPITSANDWHQLLAACANGGVGGGLQDPF